jgi:hypothetical protein
MQKFSDYLEYQGAKVFYTHLPECGEWYEGSKTGLDDFFYHGYTAEDLWHYVKRVPPELQEEIDDLERVSSWTIVDLASVLSQEPITPELGLREDGAALLYRGLVHWVYGTYESGKTWLCLLFAAQTLLAGGAVLYVDFEDSERGISSRLLQLGVPESVVSDQSRFGYVRPDEPLNREVFEAVLSRSFDIAVLDGVTESMALETLKDVVGGDVAAWQRMLPRSIAKRTGAATLCIDHVPKDQNNRVMPTGNQHKMSGLDGAAFKVLRVEPFGHESIGKAEVRVSKDRPAGVRAVGVGYDLSDNTHVVGEFVLDAPQDPFFVFGSVKVPAENGQVTHGRSNARSSRPTWCMEQASLYMEGDLAEKDRSQTKIVTHLWQNVKGAKRQRIARDTWREALEILCNENYVATEAGQRNAILCSTVVAYRQADDPNSDAYVPKDVIKMPPTDKEIKVMQARKQLEEAERDIAELDAEDPKDVD